MKNTGGKLVAGWLSFGTALLLAVEASVARWFPHTFTKINESIIISGLLAFAGAAFGIHAYESKRK